METQGGGKTIISRWKKREKDSRKDSIQGVFNAFNKSKCGIDQAICKIMGHAYNKYGVLFIISLECRGITSV